MCGIVGVVGGPTEGRLAALHRAVAALGHRGPDGSGTVCTTTVALGHTRLAVLDTTERAEQPMGDGATGCALVFNGEIYNYVELREQLRHRGHRFRSTGDTEVLLRAYLEWGEACLDRLNGMFAFGMWDPRAGGVFVARDRFGEKPLHLAAAGGRLWLSSEVKALLATGDVAAAPDIDAAFRFLVLGDVGHPRATAFAGIEQLPAAHCGWLRPGSLPQIRRWWAPPRQVTGTEPDPRAADDVGAVEDALTDAVRLRLRSDVPVGTSLSGGVDSTLLVSTMRSLQPSGDLHAFTASFPGSAADELPAAQRTAERLGLVLHAVPLGARELLDGLGALHRAQEAPVETPSVFAQHKVMEAAHRAGVTVLLDGQGADETWAGYPKYAAAAVVDDLLRLRAGRAWRREREWRAAQGSWIRPSVSRYVALLGGPRTRRLPVRAVRVMSGWLGAGFRRRAGDVDPLGAMTLPVARVGTVAGPLLDADLVRVQLPRLLRYADRNAMAWSREVRLPYLDPTVVALAMATPLEVKLGDGWTKEPLRRVLDRRGFSDIARLPGKRAFMPPTEAWLADLAVQARVREAWLQAFDWGVVADRTPRPDSLARWRVLSLVEWADRFDCRLDG